MKNKIRKKKLFFSFGNYYFRWIPYFHYSTLRWKDKFDTPRIDYCPYFTIQWLWVGVYMQIGEDEWWEQWLWYKKYSDGDLEKAEKTWPWTSMTNNKSTWNLTIPTKTENKIFW